MLVPSVLQSREHRRVSLGGVGQLVEDDDPALGLEGRCDDLPDVRPALEGHAALSRLLAKQLSIECAPLYAGRCFIMYPENR